MSLPRSLVVAVAALVFARTASAVEDIAFIAEHLPEVAMDDRYASLPLDLSPPGGRTGWRVGGALGYARVETGQAALAGPLFSLSATRDTAHARWTLLAFHDRLRFEGGRERRPLNEPFVDTPLALPVAAEFGGLGGTADDSGVGVAYARTGHVFLMGEVVVTYGLLWQRVALDRYRSDYRILEGPNAGATGIIDFSGTYAHFVPSFDVAKSFMRGAWRFDPHVRLAIPLPRRAVEGRMTGPGFDVSGDTAQAGAGKHYGDPALIFGCDVTYVPWNLTMDVGALASQALLEPITHEGVTTNWVLALRWSPR